MTETLQILTPDGDIKAETPGLGADELRDMYRWMALSREFDRRMVSLQRQGRLGTYATLEGQEAVQVGSAMALEPDDFVFPSYREHGVQLVRGMPPEVLITYWRGLPNDGWDVAKYRMGTITVPIASQLPHAVGYGYASMLEGRDEAVLVYFGDGATSESDFHAAMNFAGVWNTPTIFLCANNGYAISVPYSKQTASETIAQKAVAYGFEGVRVDGMDPLAVYQATRAAVNRARAGDGPTLIEAVTYRYGPHATADDPSLYRTEDEVAHWRDLDPIARLRKYLEKSGIWDEGADERAARDAREMVEQTINEIEARPLPGRDDAVRHAFERVPEALVDQLHTMQRAHGEPETEFAPKEVWAVTTDDLPEGPTERWNMAEAINAALYQALDGDERVIVLGEDVGLVGGVFRVTEGLMEVFGESRVIDTPLNESGIVGTAVGMALAGARPVAEIQFDGFVYPAFDQIVSHLGRYRYRSRGNIAVPVIVRFPTGAGIGAHEHHCDSPEAYFVHAPGLVVVCPTTPRDAKGLLTAALEGHDPVIFLEPKVLYRAGREDVPLDRYTVPIGRAAIRREGSDVTVVTYGAMVRVAMDAAGATEREGISVEVIDLRTLFPWDQETVLGSVLKTGRLVVLQEPQRTAGVAAEIAATIAEEAMYSLQGPIVRIAGFDAPWPQFAIEEHALIDTERVVSGIRQAVSG